MRTLLLALLLGDTTALARDYGQYEHVPLAIRQWFRDLRSPDGSIPCCDEADCLRTEAHISESRWQARAPDGSWLAVPPHRVIHNRGNPVGEPILCAAQGHDGDWWVLCFVPGCTTVRNLYYGHDDCSWHEAAVITTASNVSNRLHFGHFRSHPCFI